MRQERKSKHLLIVIIDKKVILVSGVPVIIETASAPEYPLNHRICLVADISVREPRLARFTACESGHLYFGLR